MLRNGIYVAVRVKAKLVCVSERVKEGAEAEGGGEGAYQEGGCEFDGCGVEGGVGVNLRHG